MADVGNDISRSVSESIDLVEATGHRLNEATQRSASDTIERTEQTGRRLNEATQRGITEATERVEETGSKLGQATQRGISDTIERAEATGRRLNQAAEGMFDEALRAYQTFFGFQGARRIAEVYIEFNERMVKESLESSHKLIELWFEGARRFWRVAEEGQREATSGA